MGQVKIISSLLLFVSLLAGQPANADWHEFWGRMELDWNRNNAWPEPFQWQDRQSVRATLAMQETKGWRLETTLGEHDFDSDTNELTLAGKERLYWILVRVPAARRTVFVTRAREQEATEIRVDSVQQTIAAMLPQGAMPAVVRTTTPAPAIHGEYLDKVWEAHKSNLPAPVLPADSPTGTGQ